VSVARKHQRPMQAGRGQVQAGIIDVEMPIHISNVMLVCPHCYERTRVGFTRLDDGRKVRVCKKCDEIID
jgi:large subunit ribosomal protein L24